MTIPTDDLSELRLRPSLKKWLLIGGVCLVFAAIGIAMLMSDEPKGWFVLGVFGLGLIIVPIHLLTSGIELNHLGFQTSTLRRKSFFGWDQVKDFRKISVGLNDMVGFNFSEKYEPQKKMRAVSRGLSGVEGALPDTYGMKAEDLAALMSKYQQTFVARSLSH